MSDTTIQRDSILQTLGRGRRPYLLAVAFLTYLVWAVFFPIVNFEFVDLDTPVQLLNNPGVHGLTAENITNILAGRSTTSSYYPVRALTYAADYELWELNPRGYKLTNMLVHLTNVWLLFWLLLRLFHRQTADMSPGWHVIIATYAAGIFAVHPVVVEPVAWVPGREELLMTCWILACFHCHLTARARADRGLLRSAIPWHAAAAACCLLACLSNAVAAILALLMTVWDALTLRPLHWRRVLAGTAAFWGVGIVTIVAKQVGSQHDKFVREMDAQQVTRISELIEQFGYSTNLVVGEVPGATVGRAMLVLNVFWLNLKSIAWPAQLAISYEPVATRGFLQTGVFLGLVAAVLFVAMLWLLRRHTLILFGLLWFGLTLGPASQVMHHHIHRADRFLYLPLVGLMIAFAMCLGPLCGKLKYRATVLGTAALAVLILLLLNIGSSRQVRTWENSITMWENCVRIGPDNFQARHMLADALSKVGQYERAYEHFEAALRMNAYNVKALNQFARYLATCDDMAQRDYELAIRLASWANDLTEGNDPDVLRTLALAHSNYAVDLGNQAQFAQAVTHYEKAIGTDREYAAPLFNLALLRTVCPDESFRQPEEAVRLAERACALAEKPTANERMILAVALAETGATKKAIQTTETAIDTAREAGDEPLARVLEERLKLFMSPPAEQH